jgi:hypothetical protein
MEFETSFVRTTLGRTTFFEGLVKALIPEGALCGVCNCPYFYRTVPPINDLSYEVCRGCIRRYLVRKGPGLTNCVVCTKWRGRTDGAKFHALLCSPACCDRYVAIVACLTAVALQPWLPPELCRAIWRLVVKR